MKSGFAKALVKTKHPPSPRLQRTEKKKAGCFQPAWNQMNDSYMGGSL